MITPIEITAPVHFKVVVNRAIHLADDNGNQMDAHDRYIVLKDGETAYSIFWESVESEATRPLLEEGKTYTFRFVDTKSEGSRRYAIQQIRDGKMIIYSAPLEATP